MSAVSLAEVSEYIAFHVGDQTFCIQIMAVREIRGWTPATPLPHAPGFIKGVINLRGAVLPVIDLASRLGLDSREPTARHAVIVIQHDGQLVGLLVDAVSNILTLSDKEIQPAPEVATDTTRLFVRGIVAIDNQVISVLALAAIIPERNAAAA